MGIMSSGKNEFSHHFSIAMNEKNQKVETIKQALMPYRPERIYLFGSFVHGTSDEASDMDLVIIKKTKKSFFDRLRVVGKLLPLELGAVDILVYTPDEFLKMAENGNAFAEMILEEGQLIYEA
ncbi:MAG: nucleotidyltransferase domain-containing protein [Deltaproteobacteria bacterium]|nr:nucleotidyltransferase domain-containing protein [Deltaproteobacteria bacterium]